MKITSIHAREILDSRGYPTLEAEVVLEDNTKALGQVPSGASTGSLEAWELRDEDDERFSGKGVLKAIETIKTTIKNLLIGKDAYDQAQIDRLMIEADGTENKSNLGGNAIIGISMAVCRAAARSQKLDLYKYFGRLSGNNVFVLPQPMILVLEGGKHGSWSTDIQEYFIIPKKEKFLNFSASIRAGVEIFHNLEKILDIKGYATGVGYEGAFCPAEIKSNQEAFELITEAVKKSGFSLPDDVVLGIDAAASSFYHQGRYILKSEGNKALTAPQWTRQVIEWSQKYPLWSMEDMHEEEDWEEWSVLTQEIGGQKQIVGDDLLTTNVKRIKLAAEKKAVNAVIIKPNQIGTITETLDAIKLADSVGFKTIISHRGRETNDDLIADLAVGTTSWQCKFGAPERGERIAKYNRLLRIEEQLKAGTA
jgi:enolase